MLHITCRVCRRITPYTSTALPHLAQEIAETLGMTAVHLCACADGICSDCQTAQAESGTTS